MVIFILLGLVSVLLLLLRVAFFTLFERKVMGRFHLRVGPTKVRLGGIVQPILDALKLFANKGLKMQNSRGYYDIMPLASLSLSCIIWIVLPSSIGGLVYTHSIVFFLCFSSIVVFIVLLSGWASNSKYRLIGRLRSIAQSISYEAVFSTLLIGAIALFRVYSIIAVGKASR